MNDRCLLFITHQQCHFTSAVATSYSVITIVTSMTPVQLFEWLTVWGFVVNINVFWQLVNCNLPIAIIIKLYQSNTHRHACSISRVVCKLHFIENFAMKKHFLTPDDLRRYFKMSTFYWLYFDASAHYNFCENCRVEKKKDCFHTIPRKREFRR